MRCGHGRAFRSRLYRIADQELICTICCGLPEILPGMHTPFHGYNERVQRSTRCSEKHFRLLIQLRFGGIVALIMPDKLKNQIWAYESVDFSLLCNSVTNPAEAQYTAKLDTSQEDQQS